MNGLEKDAIQRWLHKSRQQIMFSVVRTKRSRHCRRQRVKLTGLDNEGEECVMDDSWVIEFKPH